MKYRAFILHFMLFSLFVFALKAEELEKSSLADGQNSLDPAQRTVMSELLSEELENNKEASKSTPENKSKDFNEELSGDKKKASSQPVTKKIKNVFEDFIKILEQQSVESEEYRKAVKFLENSLYNEASFESLKILAQVYKDKGDSKNQINVLNILSVNYPKNPEAFYLLAMGYKNQYQKLEKSAVSKEITKKKKEYKKKIIETLNQALKTDSKHVPSYMALLDLLQVTDPKTAKRSHTRASLNVVLDMWKNLKENKYYIPLCKAYYDNRFFKQSLRACSRSIKRNPKDPISPLILSLSLPNKKKKEEKLILTAQTFPESFFVQYRTGLYFLDKAPRSAVLYLTSAHKLNPEHVELNKILARLLFDNGEEERAYDYFLSACLFTKGLFLSDFRRAKSRLRRKNKVDLIIKFQKGIQECYQKLKQNKKQEKA